MSKAHIITGWVGDGLTQATAYRPDVPFQNWAAQNPLIGYPEAPNVPNDPALVVVEVVADTATIDDYDTENPGAVIWRNHVQDPIPGPDQRPNTQRRGAMINRLKAQGVPANVAAQLVNGNPNHTARDIGRNIAEHAATLPRGQAKKNAPMVAVPDAAPTVKVLGAEIPVYTTSLGKAVYQFFGGK